MQHLGSSQWAPKMQHLGTRCPKTSLDLQAVELWKSFRCASPFPQSNRLYYYEKSGMLGFPRCWITAALFRAHLLHFLLDKHTLSGCQNTFHKIRIIYHIILVKTASKKYRHSMKQSASDRIYSYQNMPCQVPHAWFCRQLWRIPLSL